jgi:peptide/nickel transport system permease protein
MFHDAWHRFCRNRAGLVGMLAILALGVLAILAPALAARDPLRISASAFLAPGGFAPLGTDNLGRDIWSGVVYGARVSLLVGCLAALTSTLIGIAIGGTAGFYGGSLDGLLMRVTELFQTIPQFFLALVIIALAGPGLGKVIFVIGILGWPLTARLVRAEFLSLKAREFVEAARALGIGDLRMILRVILPNALPPVVVTASLEVARAILLEAGLSFFGLGDPNFVSWGTMLNNAQGFLRRAWWMSVFPGAAIFVAVLAFNLFGDALNDALNPRLSRQA